MRGRVRALALAAILPLCATGQDVGIPTEWEVQKLVHAISAQSGRLVPLLEQVHPKEWVSSEAAASYVQQWASTRSELQTLKLSSDNLVREPAKLTFALDTYFRLQNLEVGITSLIEGVRKYQNPALADLLRSALFANGANRQQLRQYVTDLAALKEQECKVMDQEAQRCRETISRQPAAAPAKQKSGK